MKIIAQTGSGYLLEATAIELAQLQGYSNQFDSNYKIGARDKIGEEIDINKMVQTAAFVRTMDKQVITELTSRLQRAMDSVNSANECVEKLNLFEKLKD